MELVKPHRLKRGDTIRIIAPASSMDVLDESAVSRGVGNLEKLGLKVQISPQARHRSGHTAGSPSERARDLMEAFEDPSVSGIMAVWGGYNSNDLLDLLDYSSINMHPKVFVGYSDITVLNTVLLEKASLVSFNGPAFVTFTHTFLMEWEVREFVETLMGSGRREIRPSPRYIDDPYYYKHPEKEVKVVPNPGWCVFKQGRAQGTLIGGHLGTLLALAGTPYWPSFEGRLLFIEEDEEGGPAGNVARELRQLRQTGALDRVAGVLIGRLPSVTGVDLTALLGMLGEVFEDYSYPVVANMDFGHTNPIATLPVGIKAEIETRGSALRILEPSVW